MMMVNVADAFPPRVSVACTANVVLPASEGVPEMIPDPLRDKPAGKTPVPTDQVYGPVPPLAASVCEYGVPAIPLGRDGVVTVTPGLTVMLKGPFALAPEVSITWTVKLHVPVVDGVPLMVPVGARARPGGSVPELTVQVNTPVPPLAAIG